MIAKIALSYEENDATPGKPSRTGKSQGPPPRAAVVAMVPASVLAMPLRARHSYVIIISWHSRPLQLKDEVNNHDHSDTLFSE